MDVQIKLKSYFETLKQHKKFKMDNLRYYKGKFFH